MEDTNFSVYFIGLSNIFLFERKAQMFINFHTFVLYSHCVILLVIVSGSYR